MISLKVLALTVIAAFYGVYFTKVLLQRKQGVQTDQIGKGSKSVKIMRIERLMKIATYAIVPVEIVSILFAVRIWNVAACVCAIVVGFCGVLVFILAMTTMRDSWRAGIPESDKTELVTTGIYRFSRNPAFLGFDLMYLGLLVAFYNPVHMIFSLYAVIMLHLQILQEEKFLADTFGETYLEYKNHTGRYFGLR